MSEFTDLTTIQWVLIGALVATQFGLLLAALIVNFRTPAERLTAPRVVWILVSFIQFVGPVVFFFAGRKPVAAAEPAPQPASGPVIDRVLAELYPRSHP